MGYVCKWYVLLDLANVSHNVDFLLLTSFRTEPPAGQLRLASPATTNFTASLLSSVASMFPSTLFSTGGDEINANCYEQDGETQAALDASGKTFEEALNEFTRVTHEAVRGTGKTPVVWEGWSIDFFVGSA